MTASHELSRDGDDHDDVMLLDLHEAYLGGPVASAVVLIDHRTTQHTRARSLTHSHHHARMHTDHGASVL